MNLVMQAALRLIQARHTRPAREARALFLQHYDPREAQLLLDTLHSAWHLGHRLDNDKELQQVYTFYKRLSLLLAAEYTLLKEGRRWLM